MNKKMPRKGYAYGSMVRSPMRPDNMTMSANPMMPRDDKMGMMYGGMAKKKNKMGMMYGGMAKKKKKMAMGGENKKFAALAPPRNKITYADKIAGATKKA
tara:strand:+ start:2951 stop:3250 length:300 start_codon:yes stop_codon:yes gene_type:complete